MHRLFALLPTLALLAACASQPDATPASVAETIARDPQLSTLNGLVLQSGLARAGDFVTVEDAMVQQADILASNGVLHKVDRVLMPPKQ